MLGDSPLIGPNDDRLGPRFPDMSAPYDPALGALARRVAADEGIGLREGVYVAVVGPNLETRAEYRFLRAIGADVVGMSTVPETIVAVHSGMRVLGLSIITDMCDPDALEPATVEKIIAVANRAEPALTTLVRRRAGAHVTAPSMTRYQPLPPDRPADDVERELLARWEEEDLFARALEARSGAPNFVFFEGPPTANGRPGIHHVFSRTIKDLFCRYRAMKGYRVARKAGWDTHGLPVEIEVEKQLGISGKQQIEAIGVAEFNRLCRESVFKYRADWEKLSARIGYWLDYEHPYVTFHNDYVESVWWALKTLFDKDLLYRGHKILPYCSRCGTALSSHELSLGYRQDEDPSVYVALDLVEAPSGRDATLHPTVGRRILVWTTTPWTLVSNIALAVHPDLDYVELVAQRSGKDQRTLILAGSRVRAVLGEDYDESLGARSRHIRAPISSGAATSGRSTGSTIPTEGEHEIIVGEDFVSADDGTGVVHMSPAFGADDYAAGRRHNLAFLQPVDARGEFPGVDAAGRRPVRQGRRSAHHRRAEAARRAVEGGAA